MGEFSTVETDGNVYKITINRPEVMNSLHPPANAELSDVFDEFQTNSDYWVAIITGAGERAFSAGNDLKYQAGGGDRTASPTSGFAGLTARWDLNKPVIAAVNGVAMGGGFEIALACDIIVASDNARFALPEPKVGLAALAGGVHRLPRQIGMKNAMGMMLTGRHVPAAEGKELGFVNEVVAQADLQGRAMEWAQQILECSPMSIRATKEAAMLGFEEGGMRAAHEGKYDAVRAMAKSEDYIEGPVAFAEKRPPNWKGR
jgi:enoyl-CoA hydratase/carnithine racemase